MIDVEKYAHKFTFPAPGKTCGFVHDAIKQKLGEDKPIVTLGHGPDFGVFRATDAVNEQYGFNVNEIVSKMIFLHDRNHVCDFCHVKQILSR